MLVLATPNVLCVVQCQMHNGHSIYTCGCMNESPEHRKRKEARTTQKTWALQVTRTQEEQTFFGLYSYSQMFYQSQFCKSYKDGYFKKIWGM